jgi:hypothetical protein
MPEPARGGLVEVPRTAQDPAKVFPECWAIAKDLMDRRDQWRRRAARHRRWFRISGMLVIVLSISLPVIVNLQSLPYKTETISAISLAIAFITALRAFWNWDKLWQALKTGETALGDLLDHWWLDLSEYAYEADETRRRHAAFRRTEELVNKAGDVLKLEAESYFGSLRWPATS